MFNNKYSGSTNKYKDRKEICKLLGRKSFLHLEAGTPNLAADLHHLATFNAGKQSRNCAQFQTIGDINKKSEPNLEVIQE